MPEKISLKVDNYSFQYRTRETKALKNISFELNEGEILLIAGASGCGKTTLMRSINGLIPNTYRGTYDGKIELYGESIFSMKMADISQRIGTVLQDPDRQIIASYVLNEVAFGLENLGLPREEIIEQVDRVLDYLNISHLNDRETFQLSGGEKQKVVLAGVLAMRPKILLLDEPLASLDPASSQETLNLLRQLANDGIAIIIVEHRVEDVLKIKPDKVIYIEEGEIIYSGDTDGLMYAVDYHRIKLPADVVLERARGNTQVSFDPFLKQQKDDVLVDFKNVSFQYKPDLPYVLENLNFAVHRGDIIAILGPNGAGKTTLVKHTLGLLKPTEGEVTLEGKSTKNITIARSAHTVGYVFQSPTQMLFAPTVEEELAFGPRNLGHDKEQIKKDVTWAIETVHLESELKMPPLALSFGQQKRVSIASILAMRSRILMMDEPTAGQDYWNYMSFMDAILQMPGFDSILFITHDIDLAVVYANRILLVYDGKIMADGPTHEVLADEELLKKCRVLPTSLLRLNLEHWQDTQKFMRAEALAKII